MPITVQSVLTVQKCVGSGSAHLRSAGGDVMVCENVDLSTWNIEGWSWLM
jgi:hypothetical protein